MTEQEIVRQNSDFDTEFKAQDPNTPESDEMRPVVHIHIAKQCSIHRMFEDGIQIISQHVDDGGA